jgi:hypothetical protein
MDRNAIAEALLQQQYDMQFGQSGNYGAPGARRGGGFGEPDISGYGNPSDPSGPLGAQAGENMGGLDTGSQQGAPSSTFGDLAGLGGPTALGGLSSGPQGPGPGMASPMGGPGVVAGGQQTGPATGFAIADPGLGNAMAPSADSVLGNPSSTWGNSEMAVSAPAAAPIDLGVSVTGPGPFGTPSPGIMADPSTGLYGQGNMANAAPSPSASVAQAQGGLFGLGGLFGTGIQGTAGLIGQGYGNALAAVSGLLGNQGAPSQGIVGPVAGPNLGGGRAIGSPGFSFESDPGFNQAVNEAVAAQEAAQGMSPGGDITAGGMFGGGPAGAMAAQGGLTGMGFEGGSAMGQGFGGMGIGPGGGDISAGGAVTGGQGDVGMGGIGLDAGGGFEGGGGIGLGFGGGDAGLGSGEGSGEGSGDGAGTGEGD